ncbi:peptide deformylase [Promicromonospora sukumoe]|uniref:Peptide deformylase n=1 Tax=Promicromonospora sukumoe TaxID=88382 RepID=A0A7W3PCB3_9MICO|nr:peptide deformylase [Promicromonospora sukumoe]MBA8806367.1 peptide deformylase [Promicromonospora sukumoe]
MTPTKPSDQMNQLGIVQAGAPILTTPARRFDLPTERAAVEETTARLLEVLHRLAEVHEFAKGRGLAAPQIGIDRAAAAVQPPDPAEDVLVLLNPRVIDASDEQDEQYEGCLSFFDVRGLVPRPLRVTVQATALDGTVTTTTYENGLARLVHHEIDHLDGLLYTARMHPGAAPIPVEQYRQTGKRWSYTGDETT